jgi:hypothetical protein
MGTRSPEPALEPVPDCDTRLSGLFRQSLEALEAQSARDGPLTIRDDLIR